MLGDGFLGRGAPFGADLNLLVQVVVPEPERHDAEFTRGISEGGGEGALG